MDSTFRKTLVREYYFAEAMAFYEAFYLPLVKTYVPAREQLAEPGRQADRPPTWVPLVFHCTTVDRLSKIFEDGYLKPSERGAVSFTEIPIGELDRMKYRHRGAEQVAIGFPRKYIESLGLTPVWYLRHNNKIQEVLHALKKHEPGAYAKIAPFVDESDDVSPFQEIRTASAVDIAEAVWILTTKRAADSFTLEIPDVDKFESKHGRIAKSYWHRSHQMGILSEWQFIRTERVADRIVDFSSIGEHYWQKKVTKEQELGVTFPVHKRQIVFQTMNEDQRNKYEGPFRFVDVARYVANILRNYGEDLAHTLPHRLLTNIRAD